MGLCLSKPRTGEDSPCSTRDGKVKEGREPPLSIGVPSTDKVSRSPSPPREASSSVTPRSTDDTSAKAPGMGAQMLDAILDKAKKEPAEGGAHQTHYLGPPKPACEDARFQTIQALHVLEAPPDPEIESILKLVSSIFNTPAALVAFFDDQRIFIKEAEGGFKRGDFPWRWSFCAWTMQSASASCMVIPDATKDARFADNAMVADPNGPGVRFYAGTPLIASNGHRLGTLCFADTKPRPEFDQGQCMILNNLAEMVVRHVEKDIALQLKTKDNKMLTDAYAQLKRAMDAFDHCVVLVDTNQPGWKLMYANTAWGKITGVERNLIANRSLNDVLEMWGSAAQLPMPEHTAAAKELKEFNVQEARLRTAFLQEAAAAGNAAVASSTANSVQYSTATSNLRDRKSAGERQSGSNSRVLKLVLRFRPASEEAMDEASMPVGVPNYLSTETTQSTRGYYFMTVAKPEPLKRPSISSQGQSIVDHGEPIEGLEMGRLLGKGAYGSVYSGTWLGTRVAVKLVDHDVRTLDVNGGASMEALLGAELRHPHIVSTLKYVVRRTGGAQHANSGSGFTDDTARSGATAGGPLSLHKSTVSANSKPAPSTLDVLPESGDPLPELPAAAAACPAVDATESAEGNAESNGRWAVIDFNQPSEDPGTSSAMVSDSTTAMMAGFSVVPNSQQQGSSFPMLGGSRSAAHKDMDMDMDRHATPPQMAQTWMIMEYCDKGSLQDAVDKGWLRDVRSCVRGVPNMEAILTTAHEMASALQYLHKLGVVHGDLSAWNVMLTSSGAAANTGSRNFVAKLADFGLARSMDIQTKIQTRTYGTITHMPPETLTNGTISRETDVYSFGVLLWQMYTGSRPWAGLTHGQIIMKVVSGEARLKFPPGTPTHFQELAESCLAFNAKDRPSMETVCKQLTEMHQDL